MTLEVRTVRDEELDAWVQAVSTGFMRRPLEGEVDVLRGFVELDRTWAGFDGERLVATYRAFASELTLPGGRQVPADAITAVAVTAPYRRRGLLTRMIEADLKQAAERGDACGILIAAEWPIYGRYGFGPADERVTWHLDAGAARFRVPGEGEVELMDADTSRREAPPVYERRRLRQAGQMPMADWRWDVYTGVRTLPGREQPHRWWARCAVDGRTVGYVVYRLEDIWEQSRPRCKLTVDALLGDTPAVEARLWRYCCEVDWVTDVRAESRSVGEGLPLLLHDGRMARQEDRVDMLWVRPLDVPRLLESRRYQSEGRLVLRVGDHAGFAAGTFALETGPDGARCAPSRETPDLDLPAASLGSVLLGGYGLTLLERAGLVREERPGALSRADSMFGWPEPPWTSVWF